MTELRDDGMTVRLVSDPLTFSESGETRSVAWGEVADWLVEVTDARMIGGYSLKAMCELVREEYGFLDGKYADVEKALVAP